MLCIKTKTSKLILPIFAFAAVMTVFAFTSVEASESKRPANNAKSAAGSIIRTDDVASTRATAKAYGLRETNATPLPNDRAIISIEAAPSNTALQLMQLEHRHDSSFEVFPNYEYRLAVEPNDTHYQDDSQWNLDKINAPKAWDIEQGSADTTIAVIDTGVLFEQHWSGDNDCTEADPCTQPDMPAANKMWTNPGETGTTELGDNCWTGTSEDKRFNNCDDDGNSLDDDWRGWDFMGGYVGNQSCPNYVEGETEDTWIKNDSDPQPYSCDSPSSPTEVNRDHFDGSCTAWTSSCFTSHGTVVGSVATAATNNSELIAGTDWNAQVMNLRVLDGYGWGDSSRITAAIEYATAMEADVINLSLAVFDSNNICTTTDQAVEDALKDAHDAGIVVAAASGNENSDVCYPANSEYAVAVGASNQNDERASFSNYGPELDVLAPGVDIPAASVPTASNSYNDYTSGADGTSLATPHVSGLAGLIKSSNGSLSANNIKNIIVTRAQRIKAMNGKTRTDKHGNGRIDANTSVKVANGEVPVYRLYNGKVHNHLLTANAKERNQAENHLGFRYEGVVFWASNNNTPDTQPVYRLYNGRVHNHLVTASPNERDSADENLGFRYEGVAFYADKESAQDNRAVHRLYNGKVYNHLITASSSERDFADENLGFRYEGRVFWVD